MIIEPPILKAVPAFGTENAVRYAIQNLVNDQVWTGNCFSHDWNRARLYAQPNDACLDMREIMISAYEHQPLTVYEAPTCIEVFGEVEMRHLQHWLSRAAVLRIRNSEYGTGVPFGHFTGEVFDAPLLPETTFVRHFVEGAQLGGVVQHPDDGEMAPQEVLDATALGIAGVLRFTEALPRPTPQTGADASAIDSDVLVSPTVIPLVLQQVALNPSLGRLDLFIVVREGAFPDRPQDARKCTTSVVVSEAGALHQHFARLPFPCFRALFHQTTTSCAALEQPAHSSLQSTICVRITRPLMTVTTGVQAGVCQSGITSYSTDSPFSIRSMALSAAISRSNDMRHRLLSLLVNASETG